MEKQYILPPSTPAPTIQRTGGIILCMTGWIVFLAAFAKFIGVTVLNRQSELGLSLDQLKDGMRLCGIGLALGCLGTPLWVLAEIKLRRRAKEESRQPGYIPPNAELASTPTSSS